MALPVGFDLPYAQKKRSAATARDATLAQNAYSRFLGQQRGSRSLVDLDRGMNKGLERLSTQFTARGMGYSGAAQRAQSDYSYDWLTKQNDIQSDMDRVFREASMSDSTANAGYDNTVADLEAQKQAQIAADAAGLQSFYPFLGS